MVRNIDVETKKKINHNPLAKIPTPKQIMEFLDQSVIGQYETKKRLAVAVYNHYKRLASERGLMGNDDKFSDVVIEKSNVLMMGPTGTGKTYLIRQIANLLGVPMYIQDCTKLTASGYVGDDVENCLTGLLKVCNYNIKLAEMGIVCLDEVDKISKKGESVSVTRDVSGECVQQALLKIVEGSRVGVMPEGGRKHPEQTLIFVDTSNILFIAMGAFVGLDKVVSKRRSSETSSHFGFLPSACAKESVGISTAADSISESSLLSQVTTDDLKSYGFIPEFIGRFPVITSTQSLTRDDLKRIVTEPKNAIRLQFEKLFHIDGKELIFEDEAIDVIVDEAFCSQTGARGLRRIFETVLNDLMFEAPGSRKRKIVVSAPYARMALAQAALPSLVAPSLQGKAHLSAIHEPVASAQSCPVK